MESSKDIAVIGIGVRFPQAENPKEFWECLRNGVDCVGSLPEGRRQDVEEYVKAVYHEDEIPHYREAAYLERIDTFDYEFFKISPKEAALMDPHQRLMLETAFQAVNNSGYAQKIRGTRTGVFIGFPTEFSAVMYQHLIMKLNPEEADNSFSGNLPAVIAGRISYFFDLKGPSLLVDTSCSSSLAAVHMACNSLNSGDSELALVGGINLFIMPTENKVVKNIGIIAPDGRTKSFDEDCDGVGQGEGVGVLILKPLSRALDDHDYIHAVIKGSAVNQDGKSIGITAPSAGAQGQVLMQAWKNAGIDPSSISYIETHGTATKLGDPTEIQGIRKAFSNYTSHKQFCGVGSVKTNIGHTIGAAGVAGMIKAILSLKQRQIPPSLNLIKPNRKIKFEDSPVYINHRLRHWTVSPRRCGVSSFGISGTNAHVVLEEAPELYREKYLRPDSSIFTLSANGREQILELVDLMTSYLKGERSDSLADICYTSAVCRLHLKYRIAIIVQDAGELIAKLDNLRLNPETPQPSVWTNLGNCISVNEIATKSTTDDLPVICRRYVQGEDIPWEAYYADLPVYKVPLPDYPFKKTRCWIQSDPRVLAYKKRNSAEKMYRTVWSAEPLLLSTVPWNGKRVILLTDRSVAGTSMADLLRHQGNNVLEIEIGSSYVPLDKDRIKVPAREEDFERLHPHLEMFMPEKIIHMTTAFRDRDPDTLAQLELNLEEGAYSLLYLVKTLQKLKSPVGVELVIVTSGTARIEADDLVQPHNAALAALGKTVKWENPQINCRSVDVGRGITIDELMAEIQYPGSPYAVALRERRRYVETIEAVSADSIELRSGPVLRKGGTYVITGGIGRIGSRLAETLSGHERINLVLLSRSSFPPKEQWENILNRSGELEDGIGEILLKLLRIERSGSYVDVRSCDISDPDQVNATFQSIRRDCGSIDGLIHLAVSDETCSLAELTKKAMNRSTRAKVHGTWILDQETREDNLSFFILFSSVMTLVSGAGNGTYTLSNAYMDAYAEYRNNKFPGSMAINWPEWEGIGLAEDKQTDEERSIFKKISSEKGLEMFSRIMELKAERLIPGELNVNSPIFQLLDYMPFQLSGDLVSQLKHYRKTKPSANHLPIEKNSGVSQRQVSAGSMDISRTTVPVQTADSLQVRSLQASEACALTGRASGMYTHYEQQLAMVWRDMFGYETINVTDNFFEIGGDSIFAFRLAAILLDKGVNVDAEDILRYQSIESIAKIMESKVEEGAVPT